MADSEITLAMLSALEAQSRAAVAEVDDALLTAHTACIIATAQHKLPANVLAASSVIVIFPELLSRQRRSTAVAGLCIERNGAVASKPQVVRLEGAKAKRICVRGGVILLAIDSVVGQAIVTGRTLGSEVRVAPGPLTGETLPDPRCALCWFFSAGELCAATLADAAVRVDHTLSDRNSSSLLSAISTAVRKNAQRLVRNERANTVL